MADTTSTMTTENPPTSELQQAFLKFRERKLRAMRNETFMKKQVATRVSPTRNDQLRKRFIECARSYFGVPYHRRYHGPDSVYSDILLFQHRRSLS